MYTLKHEACVEALVEMNEEYFIDDTYKTNSNSEERVTSPVKRQTKK